MDFASYLSRARPFDPTGLSPDAQRKLPRLFSRGTAMGEIGKKWSAELGGHPLHTYQLARQIWCEHHAWQEAVRAVSARREATGLPVLPDEAVHRTWSAGGLKVLEKAAEHLTPESATSHMTWFAALNAVADAWDACLKAGLRDGRVRLGAWGTASERELTPLGMEASVWLEARAREAAGKQEITLVLPTEAITSALEVARAAILEAAPSVDAQPIVDDVVSSAVDEGLREALDRRAIVASIAGAADALRARLEATPRDAAQVQALFIGEAGAPWGAAVVAKNLDVVASETFAAGTPADEALAWLTANAARGALLVLPDTADDAAALDGVLANLSTSVPVAQACADGLPEHAPTAEGAEPAAQAAVALARRLLSPKRAWHEIPRSALQLLGERVVLAAEDQARLDAVLDEMLAETAALREPAPRAPERKTSPPRERERERGRGGRGRRSEPSPNPALQHFGDLRPGQELKGRVASVNRFGAFVDVGLPKEGLVPIHGLTQGSNADPSSVVSEGQTVDVRVVSVDSGRGRFELALQAVQPSEGGEDAGRRGGRGNR